MTSLSRSVVLPINYFRRSSDTSLDRRYPAPLTRCRQNVVEGSARQGHGDKIKFFNIASASLSEVTYGIHAALRLGYVDQAVHDRLHERCRMVAGPFHGLIRHHRAKRLTQAVVPIVTILFCATAIAL